MKKALGQTVRDLKRGVNKKVLKVPSIEQKVLDATSNEPWGPHGSLLADIAQATRNYHEYQMIMGILWKRINDTGKNWRHVYKALTVLEYLVAHGSERVIDEIKEHAYQISTLSDFQYIDSSGRDQGSNVRRKSSSLVVLVSDKERIQEARQKAVANRDKFRGPSSTGGMYRPSSYSSSGGYGDRYDDDRYDDRNSYEREREWGYKEDDRYGRNGDPYGRDVDRYSRDSDEHNARDSYKDDDLRGRSQSVDGDRNGSRSRSSDRDPGHVDDGQHSSRQLERNFSEQNLGAPPSYEDAVSDGRSPVHSERRDGENSGEPAPKPSSPPSNAGASQSTVTSTVPAFPVNQEVEAFDAFDPRSPVTAAPTTSTSAEVDLFGSLSDSFSSNSLAIVPAPAGPTASEADAPPNSGSGPTFATAASASYVNSQPFEDPFGDSPFKAVPSTDSAPAAPPQNFASAASFQANMDQSTESSQPVAPKVDAVSNFDFGETLPGITYTPPTIPNAQQETTDILADILPPAAPSNTVASQAPFPAPTGHPAPPNANMFGGFDSLAVSTSPHASPQTQYYNENTFQQAAATQATSQPPTGASWMPQAGQPPQPPTGASWMPQTGQSPMSSQAALSDSTGALAIVPTPSSKDKFDPKSTVWADTLSRGLVNLNISGPKTNPLADIGVDFDAINRKEKRMEKPSAAPATSNVTMGKAMGSGTGMGRAGASSIRPPSNATRGPVTGMGGGPFMGMGSGPAMGMGMGRGPGMGMGMSSGPGMGMGMGGGPGLGMGGGPGMGMGMGGPGMGMGLSTGVGMGMGGYGGMNQQQQMGMNMSMGQRAQMQPPIGLPPGSAMPGNYNPAMGGGYGTQQPYGGGYR